LAVSALLAGLVSAQTDKIKYVEKYEYPIFKEMEAKVESLKAERDSVTAEIRQRQKEQKEKEKKEKKKLLLDFAGIKKPASPDVFTSTFHFPPVAQYITGTCWSFSGTSFLESEVFRLTGREIKLSEMHTVYYEWVEKARRFVTERGDSRLGQGSETNAVLRVFKKYGAVPLGVYPGLADTTDERHDHSDLAPELRKYLALVKDNDLWDEEQVISAVKLILNKHLGTPPEAFEFEGKTITPLEFVRDVLRINPDDYVALMSTMSVPFYTTAEFEVYDNWWHDDSYHNVPLNVWYQTIKKAIQSGYSLTIGGDISEPGMNGFEDAAVVPDYDIPQNYINQHSREFRIYNRTTGDDHGVHLIGYKKVGGRDWFLIKDSASRARYGKHDGYLFFRDDYLKLKMLTCTVHKDAIKDIADKFARASPGDTEGAE